MVVEPFTLDVEACGAGNIGYLCLLFLKDLSDLNHIRQGRPRLGRFCSSCYFKIY